MHEYPVARVQKMVRGNAFASKFSQNYGSTIQTVILKMLTLLLSILLLGNRLKCHGLLKKEKQNTQDQQHKRLEETYHVAYRRN